MTIPQSASSAGEATTVQTATGPVPVASLGKTLMHEHVFTFRSDLRGDYPWKNEQAHVDGAVDKLRRLKDADYTTVVDLTVPGLGRDVARVARIAGRADVNVLTATGVYTFRDMPSFFRRGLEAVGPSYVEDFFVREITDGIGDTGVRAALLKCVTDVHGLTPDVETLLRSAARAHHRTGAPISTHTHAALETGLLQQRVFREEGVDLSEVVIGHSDCTTDLAYLQRLIDAGSYIGMDRFGNYAAWSLEGKLRVVTELCRRGHASAIVLSHDTNCGGDFDPQTALEQWRYGEIPTVVVPALQERGVSEEDLRLMLIENPRRIFERAAQHAAAATAARAGDSR